MTDPVYITATQDAAGNLILKNADNIEWDTEADGTFTLTESPVYAVTGMTEVKLVYELYLGRDFGSKYELLQTISRGF